MWTTELWARLRWVGPPWSQLASSRRLMSGGLEARDGLAWIETSPEALMMLAGCRLQAAGSKVE